MNKIVIVDPNAYGGHNDFCRSLALLLSGKDPEIVYINREDGARESIDYKHIATGYSDQSFKNKIKSYFTLTKYLKKLSDEGYAIHFQDINYYLLPAVILLVLPSQTKRTLYYTLHNITPHENNFKERFAYKIIYQLLSLDAFKKIIYHFEFIKTENEFVTKHIPTAVQKKMVFIPHHMFHTAVPNTKKSLPIDRENQKINILFFGDIRRVKGLLEFFTLVYDHNIDTKGIQFIVAGAFSEYSEDELRKIIDQPNYKINIQIENRFIEDHEKVQLFTNAHYILLPYLDDFLAQSGVVLDAYQYQKPLIASSNPSLKYLVTHELTGYTYTEESLRSFLEQQIYDQGQYDSCVQNINKVLLHKYDNSSIKKLYMNTYFPESVSWV